VPLRPKNPLLRFHKSQNPSAWQWFLVVGRVGRQQSLRIENREISPFIAKKIRTSTIASQLPPHKVPEEMKSESGLWRKNLFFA
jgi:hypothetical protein